MYCILIGATDGPISARPCRSIIGLPALVRPKISKLYCTPFPAAVVDEHNLGDLEFHASKQSSAAVLKMRTW